MGVTTEKDTDTFTAAAHSGHATIECWSCACDCRSDAETAVAAAMSSVCTDAARMGAAAQAVSQYCWLPDWNYPADAAAANTATLDSTRTDAASMGAPGMRLLMLP